MNETEKENVKEAEEEDEERHLGERAKKKKKKKKQKKKKERGAARQLARSSSGERRRAAVAAVGRGERSDICDFSFSLLSHPDAFFFFCFIYVFFFFFVHFNFSNIFLYFLFVLWVSCQPHVKASFKHSISNFNYWVPYVSHDFFYMPLVQKKIIYIIILTIIFSISIWM